MKFVYWLNPCSPPWQSHETLRLGLRSRRILQAYAFTLMLFTLVHERASKSAKREDAAELNHCLLVFRLSVGENRHCERRAAGELDVALAQRLSWQVYPIVSRCFSDF